MSLILDALRKSEAERRRGQAPSLYAATPVPTTRARPEWLKLLPIAAIVVLLLVALMTWLGSDQEPATKQELQEEADAPSLLPPTPAQLAAQSGAADSTAASAAAPTPSPAASAKAAVPAPSVDALVQAPAAPPVATAPAPSAIIAAPQPLPPAPDASEEAAQSAATTEQLPPVAVLDAGTRSSLPALRMSMHVYNEDASRRFATIDGQRVIEGSRVGSATVVEIRRDGVVLDVNGQRVLLPKP